MSNPFICNCRLNWLRVWLKNSNLATGNPKCSYPESLKDRSIANTNEYDFVCGNNDQDDECSTSMVTLMSGEEKKKQEVVALFSSEKSCPQKCSCSNDIVRCSHLGLKQIPNDIPSTVKEL